MSRVLRSARREYLERARSKAFLIGTVLGPLILFGAMLGPSLLMSKQRGKPLKVAVLDHTGVLREEQELFLEHHARVQPPLLRHVADPVAAAPVRRVAQDLDVALVGPQHVHDHAQRGGLAGPVRSQQAEDAPARDGQGEAVNGDVTGEGLADAGQADRVLGVQEGSFRSGADVRAPAGLYEPSSPGVRRALCALRGEKVMMPARRTRWRWCRYPARRAARARRRSR